MEDQYADTCRISIYADDTNGILGRLFQLFSKSRFGINFIQIFETKDKDQKLIVVDSTFPKEMMPLMLNRIEKIMEVHFAIPHTFERIKQFLGIYTVPIDFRDNALYDTLIKRGIQIRSSMENKLVLQLIGDEKEIQEVHQLLSGTVSTSFYKSMWPDVATFTSGSDLPDVSGFETTK
jgi:acetolactate synthase small subunit